MAIPASDERIRELLDALNSADPRVRAEAARELGESDRDDQQIILALDRLKSVDTDAKVVAAASEALAILRPAYVPPLTRKEKIERYRDFTGGFVGWYVVNGVIWGLQGPTYSMYGLTGNSVIVWLIMFPSNVIALIALALFKRGMALGILTALALNFAVTLVLSLIYNALCGIPFFVPVRSS